MNHGMETAMMSMADQHHREEEDAGTWMSLASQDGSHLVVSGEEEDTLHETILAA